MEIERKRLTVLQTTFKFLEKIESKLPYNLAYECSRIKEAMTCVGASPNYINIPGDPTLHKSTLERRKREPLTLMKKMSPFKTTKTKDSSENEPISKTKHSPELEHIIKTASPINIHQQSQSIPTKLKTSFSPISNPHYSNVFGVNSEPRNITKTSTDYPLHISKSPLPSTPITPEDNSINLPPIYRSPLPHAPTYGVKESPPAPKTHELVGDDVTFILGTSSSTPQCYTQCKRVPHSYLNVVEDNKNRTTEYQNTKRVIPTCPGMTRYNPSKREMIHN